MKMIAVKKIGLYSLLIVALASCSKKEAAISPEKEAMANTKNITTDILRSPVGDVVGKLVVGYQGWFGAAGDGSAFNSWRHWAASGTPAPGNQMFELYPDTREYLTTFQTGYGNLGNGQPAKLFSSWTSQTVAKHFQWMQQYGIDCAAIQRFGNYLYVDSRDKAFRDGIVAKARNQAENYDRKFYIMYDISGWNSFQAEIKTDWTNAMQVHTNSTAYAKQNGKPVVCIWGIGVSGRPGDVTSWTDVINWFKAQGCYVIAGTARGWRTDATNMAAYHAADMITPWSVGTFSNLAEADTYASVMQADVAYLDSRGQDYQPVAFPGFAWSNWKPGTAQNMIPRLHGDFMWRQFANIRVKGIPSAYVAMFDEYDEATAIAKAAENSSMIPTNQYFLTLDADGIACSADFYLRLTGDGARMIKQQIPHTSTHPTAHVQASTSTKKLIVGSTVSLTALVNGKYVCADDGGNSPLIADRTSAGQWEKFTIVDAGNGKIALRSLANNQYVCADNGGASPLIANRTVIGSYETFTEVDAGNGNIGLLADVNNKYVCADNSGNSPLIANRTSVDEWESFIVTTY
ncbi:lectin [Sphingobacterium haloxyli]|uniref:Lectin n=1 Tax=Sphingobacterium haloxyli TaxID=2100533 RepID=A0A2S9J814_9SPHI|nr:lectin [Sphingobacterium haloxyli]PRD48887.1 lectin [Sphingobacterium haloxyli]